MNESIADLFQIFDRATPMIFALIPSILAVALFFFGKKKGNTVMKWMAYVPLLIGLVLGVLGLQLLNDSLFVQLNLLGSRSELLYRAVLIIPIVVGIALILFDKLAGREINSNL
ncbi:MAG: hypothetical protein ACKVQS_03685 [Fimbriimonadaceae bacterium]